MDQSGYDQFGYGQDPSQYGQYAPDQSLYDQTGEFNAPPSDLYGFNSGFVAPSSTRNSQTNMPLLPQPPDLQIQAQVDAEGNWYYPSADLDNRDLRIQCEAFRAGAASRSGVTQPFNTPRASMPRATPKAPQRMRPQPVSTRVSSGRVSKPIKKTATGRKKKTSVAQVCVCNASVFTPKRPPNAFMLYRTKHQPQLVKMIENDPSLRKTNKNGVEASMQATVSSIASQWWNEAKNTGEDRQYWDLAEAEKAAHAARYPNYKYQSGKKYQLNWGDESCTCGAYQANEAKRRDREAGRDAGLYDTEYGDEEEFEEDPPYHLSARPRESQTRPSSRTSLVEPPSNRRANAFITNTAPNTGYPAGFDNSVFPPESYGGDFNNAVYGSGFDNNLLPYGSTLADTNAEPQPSQPPQRRASVSSSEARRRRASAAAPNTIFPIGSEGVDYSEDDFRYLLGGFQDTGTGDYDFVTGQVDNTANELQTQNQNTRARGAGRRSFDSLFDMDVDEITTRRRSSSERRRSSRIGPSSPANPGGIRRSSRRSPG